MCTYTYIVRAERGPVVQLFADLTGCIGARRKWKSFFYERVRSVFLFRRDDSLLRIPRQLKNILIRLRSGGAFARNENLGGCFVFYARIWDVSVCIYLEFGERIRRDCLFI